MGSQIRRKRPREDSGTDHHRPARRSWRQSNHAQRDSSRTPPEVWRSTRRKTRHQPRRPTQCGETAAARASRPGDITPPLAATRLAWPQPLGAQGRSASQHVALQDVRAALTSLSRAQKDKLLLSIAEQDLRLVQNIMSTFDDKLAQAGRGRPRRRVQIQNFDRVADRIYEAVFDDSVSSGSNSKSREVIELIDDSIQSIRNAIGTDSTWDAKFSALGNLVAIAAIIANSKDQIGREVRRHFVCDTELGEAAMHILRCFEPVEVVTITEINVEFLDLFREVVDRAYERCLFQETLALAYELFCANVEFVNNDLESGTDVEETALAESGSRSEESSAT